MKVTKKIISLILGISMLVTMGFSAYAETEINFSDVKESDWFYNDVKTAYETGLINGKSETAYAPNDNMTYAEAIKLAACMNQYAAEGKISFESSNPWYQVYVNYAINNSIISKNYEYNTNATRSGYMEIFANCLPDENLKAINSIGDNSIPDVKSTEKYAPAVYKLYRAGILTGVDDEHNCNPSANIKRSEVAAILTRMMNPGKRISFSVGSDSEEADEAEDEELKVTTQPKDTEVGEGEEAKFNVTVSGGKKPYTYKWYYDSDASSKFFPCTDRAEYYEWFLGVDSDTLTVKQLDSSLEGSKYYCVVTDAEGKSVISDTAELTVKNGITVQTQPQSISVAKGKDADFLVSVKGGKTPYKFQWYYCNAGMSKFGRCEDATEWYERFKIDNDGGNYSLLTVFEADEYMKQDGAQYYCVITDEDGNTVVSNTAILSIAAESLSITAQPSNAEIKDPGTPKFTVDVSVGAEGGTEPYKYQWYLKGFGMLKESLAAYEGCTSSTLTLVNPTPGNYYFYCVITDSAGVQVTSNTAHILIKK